MGLAGGVDDAYPHLRHLVFSRTLEKGPGPAVELVRGDAVERVRALKQEEGKASGWSAAASWPVPSTARSTGSSSSWPP
ncbi:hypothetical protein [Streptomyces sp. NPDC058373]|uniref:hypothetical protein n=1 Tax=Streptomyces sp. NPDC058373 TaxID=3346465 RepID=UPI003649C309